MNSSAPCPCPKCGRTLQPSGELTVGGRTLDVYQCDECLTRDDFAGEAFESALTFARDRGDSDTVRLLHVDSLEPLTFDYDADPGAP